MTRIQMRILLNKTIQTLLFIILITYSFEAISQNCPRAESLRDQMSKAGSNVILSDILGTAAIIEFEKCQCKNGSLTSEGEAKEFAKRINTRVADYKIRKKNYESAGQKNAPKVEGVQSCKFGNDSGSFAINEKEAARRRMFNKMDSYLKGVPVFNHDISKLQNASSPQEVDAEFLKFKRGIEEENKLLLENYNNLEQDIIIDLADGTTDSGEELLGNMAVLMGGAIHSGVQSNANQKKLEEAEQIKIQKFDASKTEFNKIYENNYRYNVNAYAYAENLNIENQYLNNLEYWKCAKFSLNKNFSYENVEWVNVPSSCGQRINIYDQGQIAQIAEYFNLSKRKFDISKSLKIALEKDQLRSAAMYFLTKYLEQYKEDLEAIAFRSIFRKNPIDAFFEATYANHLDSGQYTLDILRQQERRIRKYVRLAIEKENTTSLDSILNYELHKLITINFKYSGIDYSINKDKLYPFKLFYTDHLKGNVDFKDQYFASAVKSNSIDIINYLVKERGVNPNAIAPNPLVTALQQKSESTFSTLLALDSDYRFAYYLIKDNKEEKERFLQYLARSANNGNESDFTERIIDDKLYDRQSINELLQLQIQNKNSRLSLKVLEEIEKNDLMDSKYLLHEVIKNDLPQVFDKLLSMGYPMNELDGKGLPACHYFLNGGKNILYTSTMWKTMDFNQKDSKNAALIHKIVYHTNDISLLDYLMRNSVLDSNLESNYKWTALHFAAKEGKNELAKVLIAANANKSLKDEWGRTPYKVAKEQKGDKTLLKSLK